jgi:multisubunit Na+/H+ antiporter MnhE subunit
MIKIITDFYKECVNYNNVKSQILFIFVPYLFTQNWHTSIYWGIGYLISVIIIWLFIRYFIKPKNK